VRLLAVADGTKDAGHATTAHGRVHRPQSSLRLGLSLYAGRGRFFLGIHNYVRVTRPIVAVIEADAAARRLLCSLLSSLDAEIQDYESAESYLASEVDALGCDTLGCVITDVMLPGMSGLELLRRLRATQSSPPVIVLGEETDVRTAVDAMREGAADFIEKQHMDLAIPRRVAYLLDRMH
jgi:FixJ family two-component response regulator